MKAIFWFKNLNHRVQFLLCVFIVVAFTGKANANTSWDLSNTGRPYKLVYSSIDLNFLSSHSLLCKLTDFTHSTRSFLFESDLVGAFTKINGVVCRNYILADFLLSLGHFECIYKLQTQKQVRYIVTKNIQMTSMHAFPKTCQSILHQHIHHHTDHTIHKSKFTYDSQCRIPNCLCNLDQPVLGNPKQLLASASSQGSSGC
mmetsp:Transcript_30659/g.49184  ORF Transcript_30659/g.49184 Transcript_30659/m.49184 type:complete len:201 (+) Transcript_30659:3665-4267(+)